jgi:hypothetical protein
MRIPPWRAQVPLTRDEVRAYDRSVNGQAGEAEFPVLPCPSRVLCLPDAVPADQIRMVAPLARDDDEAAGGDPVCWAHLVCDECGAVTAEGHRAGCSAGAPG